MQLSINDIILRAKNGDFRNDFAGAQAAFTILRRSGCEAQLTSCINCEHYEYEGGFGGSYYEPPEPGESWCNLLENQEATDIEVAYDEMDGDENFFGGLFCQHYEVRIVGSCSACGAHIETPEHEHAQNLWLSWEGPEAVCSETCREKKTQAFIAYHDAEQKAEEEAQDYFQDYGVNQ